MYPFVFRKCIVKGIIITFSGISDFSGILLNGFDRVITKCGRTFKQNLFIRRASCCLFHPEGKAGSCRRFVKRCFNAGITFHRQGFADFSFCVSCMFSRHCIVFVLGSITSVFFVKIVFCVSTSHSQFHDTDWCSEQWKLLQWLSSLRCRSLCLRPRVFHSVQTSAGRYGQRHHSL